MHWTWRGRLTVLAGFLLMQAWPYEAVSNPPEAGLAPMPPEISKWVRESCFDCHSNQTRWPWYASLAPLSWVLADDVRRGRAGLNFSRWSEYSPRQRAMAWRRSLQRIREHRMPPLAYTVIHPTGPSQEQLKQLESWLKAQELSAADALSPSELLAWPSLPLPGVKSGRPLQGAFRAQGSLPTPLIMDHALILADGDLMVPHGITGSGAILATGNLSIEGCSGESGPWALIALGKLRLRGEADSRLTGLLHCGGKPEIEGIEFILQPSFTMEIWGIRERRLEFCRDDGQLGERLERQVLVRYAHGQYVIWDPEFQTVQRANSLDTALDGVEAILRSDPATSVARWLRRFRSNWKQQLRQLPATGQPALLRFQATEGAPVRAMEP